MNTQGRTESTMIKYAHATAMAGFLALLVTGYGVSAMYVPTDGVPAVTGQPDLRATPYFPAQYVNRGQSLEEHIQAF